MRHYYDIYELLKHHDVRKFIGTAPYKEHKRARFRQVDNQNIAENQAFILSDVKTRTLYADAYECSSAALLRKSQPSSRS